MTVPRFGAELALDALARSPLFQGIAREDLERIARTLARRRYRRNEVIFHEGDPGDRLYVIVEGKVIGAVGVSGVMSAWIVLEAARFKLPGVVLVRMIMNATLDFAVGLIPFLGDLFDLGFKANTRNLELFHRHAVDPGASTSGSAALVAGIALVFVGILWAGLVLISRFLSLVVG